jgi:hypothetical protein
VSNYKVTSENWMQCYGGPHDGKWIKVKAGTWEYLVPIVSAMSVILTEDFDATLPAMKVGYYQKTGEMTDGEAIWGRFDWMGEK